MGGVEPPAKLFSVDWLEHTGPVLPGGPPVSHSSMADILMGAIFPQLVNFSFNAGGIFGHMIRVNFAL